VLTARRPKADRGSLRRSFLVTPAIAVAMLVVTVAAGSHYGIGLRDPDGVVGGRLLGVLALVAFLWALDIVPRAVRAARAASEPLWPQVRAVAHQRWSPKRVVAVLGTIVCFYLTYLCYRNVKSYLPLARDELYDDELLRLESRVFGDHPARLLHDLLGTGVSAHVLSLVYVLFLSFVPLSIAVALVWSSDLRSGLWWVSALSLNWALGAASYFLLPSMGPIYAATDLFAALPDTPAAALQDTLWDHRRSFLADPQGSDKLQSIAAFASLHVSITLTGALVAQLLRAPRVLRIGLWAFAALTAVATIYLGWHYVVDDVAGVAIALIAVFGAARLTGWRIVRTAPAPRREAAQATARAT
jgi:membrane-associated phospholipid phosphatase